MPITEDRMLALLAAGEDLQQALEASEQSLRQVASEAEGGMLSAGEALAQALLLVGRARLRQPIESSLVLAVERQHFQLVRGRNRAARRRMALKRGKARGEQQDD